jgi:hypothetical protein
MIVNPFTHGYQHVENADLVVPRVASSACMPLSTTHSTCSDILSLAQLSGSSDQMRLRNGAPQLPPHEAEPVAPQSRPKRLNLTMPPPSSKATNNAVSSNSFG